MQIREAAKERNRQTTWYVIGDSGTEYIVHNKRNAISHHKVWTCNCPDWTERRQFNGTDCKHIVEVQSFVNLKIAREAADAVVPTVKQVIDTVVRVFNGPRAEAKLLWDILTALRGPDSNDDDLKAITTAPIRGVIGIKSAGNTGVIVSDARPFGTDLDFYVIVDQLMREHKAQAHFASHYRAAVAALKQLGYVK